MGKPLPISKVSERALLGKLFFCPDRLPDIVLQVSENDFWYGRHRAIWRAFVGLCAKGVSIDAISVYQWIADEGNVEGVKTTLLAKLHKDEITAADIDTHVLIVKERSAQRKLITVVEQISDQARCHQDDIPAFLSRSLEAVIDATSSSVSGEPVHIRDGITDMVTQAMEPNPVRSIRVPTGIDAIDRLSGGILNEQLNLIVARPSMGKTSVLCNIAMSLARYGPVLWFSLEETLQQLQFIMTSILSGIPYSVMQEGGQTSGKIAIAASKVAQLPIHIERNRTKLGAMVQRCLAFKGRHGSVSGVLIDHAALIKQQNKTEGHRGSYDLFNEMSEIPGRLGCPLVVAHQLNRGLEDRPDNRPRIRDLRDAGEEPSKMIIALHREWTYDKQSDPGIMEAIVLKNKGPIGTAMLDVDIKCARIYNGGGY